MDHKPINVHLPHGRYAVVDPLDAAVVAVNLALTHRRHGGDYVFDPDSPAGQAFARIRAAVDDGQQVQRWV